MRWWVVSGALLALAAPAFVEGAIADEADAGTSLDADAPRVGASLDRTEAHVGDRLTLTVSAIARGALPQTVQLPLKLDLGKFEVLDSSTTDRDLGDGNRSRRFTLQIAAYETGELELPPIVLEYTDAKGEKRRVETTSIPVSVKSLVGEDPAAEAMPLAAQRSAMMEDRRLYQALGWAGAAAALLVALLIARTVLRRRRLRPRPVVILPPRPAHEIALERLAALRRRGEFDRDGYRPFFFAAAEILRAYLGQRFGFDSLELTTTELRAELGRIADPLLDTFRARIDEFLAACDLVKFAKAPSSDVEARATLDAAEAIVAGTCAALAPPVEVAHG